MTTYNTGNPIGSTAVKDLYDNTENLDVAVNSPDLTWTDRLGVTRQTMAGATGYEFLGDYAAGIELGDYTQVVKYNNEFYRASASATLPFTTTGTWATDESSLVSVGDATLRQDLLAPDGALLVGNAQIYKDTVADATASSYPIGAKVSTQGYYAAGDGGQADYLVVDATAYGSTPDGYGDHYDAAGNVLVLQYWDTVSLKQYGAKPGGGTDSKGSFIQAFSKGVNVTGDAGDTYLLQSGGILVSSGTTFSGNNCKIIASYEQDAVSPAYSESVFYVNGKNDVSFKNIEFEFTGTFTVGSSYGGYISAIHVENSDNFLAHKITAYGFNRAGINVAMGVDYCSNPKVDSCNLHNNRVAGCIFGNTNDGTVSNNRLAFNGEVSSIETGYGFTGWSACIPRNTLVENNHATDNYRKGLDFHAGENGVISGNNCARNRIYGIFVMGVTGGWIINGNTISEMAWGNEFPTQSPYGISVGDYLGQGLTADPTSFIVNNNTIHNFTKTAGDMYPIGDTMVGCSYGKLTVSNNIFDVGVVSKLYNGSASTQSGTTNGNYYDVSITNNQFSAIECTSSDQPIHIRSGISRQKTFNNNTVNISTAATTSGIVVYDVSTANGDSFTAIGNTLNVPELAWSSIYDPIYVRRTLIEVMSGNIVNSNFWRDWVGGRFVSAAGSGPPTTNFWSRGSLFWQTTAAAGQAPGYYCVAGGVPGTWKAMAAIAA